MSLAIQKRLFGKWILSVDAKTDKALLSCFYRGCHYMEAYGDSKAIDIPFTLRRVKRIV